MCCQTCPYRSSCANAKPPCYVPTSPYIPQPYPDYYSPGYHTTGGDPFPPPNLTITIGGITVPIQSEEVKYV